MTAPLPRALATLYARVPLGMRLGLEPMRAACAKLGNPERAFPAVHVAGTNGKGSVAAMVEAIARAEGWKTGLYTSPHLVRFAERIRIGGEPIEDDDLSPLLDDALALEPELSFFEGATMAAFLAFRAAKVDLAVIEVGLGGRLDATNVLRTPRTAAITRIALDHTAVLGGTLPEIAREKAGIAKPGLEMVLGPGMSAEVRAAIEEVARAAGARTYASDEDEEARAFAERATIGLAGDHQIANARIAWRLGERVGASERARAEGIANVRWPGRLERLRAKDGGEVLLDGAHNPDGAEALARYLRATTDGPARTALVFGALADKVWTEMLDVLAPLAAYRAYVTPPAMSKGGGVPRAATEPSVMAARHAGEAAADLATAYAHARAKVGAGGLVVICGSLYLVGDARAMLLGLPRDPPVSL